MSRGEGGGRPPVLGPTLGDMAKDTPPGRCPLCGDATRRFKHGGFARYCGAPECATAYQRLYKRGIRHPAGE